MHNCIAKSYPASPSLTLNQFFDQHYFPHAKVAKAQHKHDFSTYNTHMRLVLGEYLLADLKTAVLDVWVREQIVAGYQRSTINKHIHLMNRLLNLARSWGWIDFARDHQPIAYSGAIRPPIPKVSGHRFRFYPATDSGVSGHPVM